jgi:2-hydroxychromene-2-carboxylate isomerase
MCTSAGRTLEFWYDFASTYSYLSAMRIEDMAKAADVQVVWRPFLLGPIFKGQGWDTSPFTIYPAKGRYMVRDMERLATGRGLSFRMPGRFPQSSLAAARVALVGADEGWIADFTRAIYTAEFGDGKNIGERDELTAILHGLRLDSDRIFSVVETPALKQKLKDQTAVAQRRGIFGAPSFTCRGELFWGDDRLEQAIAWADGDHS